MKQFLFIVNPHAGKQKDLSNSIRQIMSQSDIEFDIIKTTHRGHAKQITQQADHYHTVVAVGGDGTINEIINGMQNHHQLGIIAMGSGNDFARSVALPINNIDAALAVLSKKEIKTIDLGEINGTRFINAIGIGFDGYANHLSEKLTWITSGLKYYAAIALALIHYRPQTVEIELNNNTTHTPLFMLSINNGIFVGNGLPTAPNAQLDDGKLDLIQVNRLRRYRLITQFPRMCQGQMQTIPEVQHQLIDQIKIVAKKPLYIHYDGEALHHTTEASIRVLPHSLSLIC